MDTNVPQRRGLLPFFAPLGYLYERYCDGNSGAPRLEQVLQKISAELEPQLEEKWEAHMRNILNSESNKHVQSNT